MNHEQFSELLQGYLENSLDEGTRAAIGLHLKVCHDCTLQLQILADCRVLDEDGEVPATFSSSWRQAIKQQEDSKMEQVPAKAKTYYPWRRWAALAASLVFIVGGGLLVGNLPALPAAQDASMKANSGGLAGLPVPAPYNLSPSGVARMEAEFSATPESVSNQEMQTRIIRTFSLRLSTERFDEDLAILKALLAENGGYVEYSDISADTGNPRFANLTLRVPEEKVDLYLQQAQGVGRTLSISESQEDVSEQYMDVDTRLRTQVSKMERLQALLGQAITVEDILNIESEIADTQYEVDRLTGALRGMDSRVQYAALSLSLSEERALPETAQYTLLQRIRLAVADAWLQAQRLLENMAIFLSVVLPYLLAASLIVYILIRLFRRKQK